MAGTQTGLEGQTPYYVDIHCHPTFLPFNRSDCTTINEFWPPLCSLTTVNKERFSKTPTFLQSDFTTLAVGSPRARVVFASLLPLEQGFLLAAPLASQKDSCTRRFVNREFARAGAAWAVKVPPSRSGRVQDRAHDYYYDLLREFHLLEREKSWTCPAKVLAARPRAQVVSTYAQLCTVLQGAQDVTGIIITIEGGHSLGCGSANLVKGISDPALYNVEEPVTMVSCLNDPGFANPQPRCAVVQNFKVQRVRALVYTLLCHVKQIKRWGDNGSYAPFFITFSHHFWNQLCGHALSLPKLQISGATIGDLWDQTRGLEAPMTEVGKLVICALLSTNNGRLSLIDTKHMSIEGKSWYYDAVKEFNGSMKAAGSPHRMIPIISSHSAASDRAEMPETGQKDRSAAAQLYKESTNFNPWDINLSDEEIVIIHESNGLIGLNFDERILAGEARRTELHAGDFDPNPMSGSWSLQWAQIIAEHVFHAAKVIAEWEGLGDSPTWSENEDDAACIPWQRLAIGSDFDGVIDPVDAYCRAMEFADLESQLLKCLTDMAANPKYKLLKNLPSDSMATIVDWFMRGNAMRFLSRFFTDTYRL